MKSKAFSEEEVLTVHHWTDRLFSFTTTRDEALRFKNGHFTMIGLPPKEGERPLLRAYSIASANYEEQLEFLSIKVPDGPLTSKLQHIKPGDKVIVGRKPTGTLVTDYLLPGSVYGCWPPAPAWPPSSASRATPIPTSATTRSSWCTACVR